MDTLNAAPHRILIVGAGGFGREVLQWARDTWRGRDSVVAGFLSADPNILDGHDCGVKVLENPENFELQPGDAMLLAIGIPETRRRVAEHLATRGVEFLTLIHPTAIVSPTATIGPGTIICPNAIVSDAARIGRCVVVNYHASLAHDSSVGDYAVMSPYAALAGGAQVGEDAFLGIHASVGPRVSIGARSKLAANSCALHDVPANSIVHGVPGRVSPRLG